MNVDVPSIKVSVLMITYNHEKFVEQAVRSVLDQQTKFRVELVIGEDCSTDTTRQIVVRLADQYPSRIRLILQERNVGAGRNFTDVFHACTGTYIALLEGDDYWTDPFKLQKQVELLDSDTTAVLCHHNALAMTSDGASGTTIWKPGKKARRLKIAQLISQNELVTCSTLFRNGIVPRLPDWYVTCPIGDWPLQILLAQHGDALYIDQPMSVYRIHSGSWSAQSAIKNLTQRIVTVETFRPHLPSQCQPIADKTIRRLRWHLIEEFIRQRQVDQAKIYASDHACDSAFLRLSSFYRAEELEFQGRRIAAFFEYFKAGWYGWRQSRIGWADIAIALLRTGCPSIYRLIRLIFRRLR